MQFHSTEDLFALPDQSWVIRGLLPETGLSLLYGPSEQGKSFVSIDWALCVSTGMPWLGEYPVKQGHVVYIASEGGRGIKRRVAAWMQYHGINTLPNITWFLDSLNLREENVVEEFLAALEDRFPPEVIHHDDEFISVGVNLKLIVIDTLSRNFGGEDENASTAMAGFVARLEMLCKAHECAVLIVHHTNAQGGRERGHSSLRGAMEAAFECAALKEDDTLATITIENNKQKDDKSAGAICLKPLRLELPELPLDDEGEVLTSLVLLPSDEGGADRITRILDDVAGLLQEHGRLNQDAITRALGARYTRLLVRKALSTGVARNTLRRVRGPHNSTVFEAPESRWLTQARG